jgi:cytochrome c peroxidase
VRSSALLVALVVAVALAACSTSGTALSGDDGGAPDPDPQLSEGDRAALATLSPPTLPPPPADRSNRFADEPAARALGQTLFFEASFAGALLEGDNDGSAAALGRVGDVGKVSCAGCHLPAASFADNRSLHTQLSLAARWTHRRTPALLDVGQSKLLMWDGRKDSLFAQIFGPIESVDEMNSSRLYVAEQLFLKYRVAYEAIFGPMPPLDDAARFPTISASTTGCKRSVSDAGKNVYGDCHGKPGDGAEFDGMAAADRDLVTTVVVNAGKAIGAYERTLACGPSRFDAWMRGDASALSRSEQRGAQLFVAKGRCVACHGGPFLSDQSFHNVGLKPVGLDPTFREFLILDDPGAAAGFVEVLADPLNSAGKWSDGSDGRLPTSASGVLGGHKVPTLRCVAQRPSFMHTGQLQSLEDVVGFFARGGDAFGYPGKNELQPLALSPRERADLVAFLRALDGPGPPDALRH